MTIFLELQIGELAKQAGVSVRTVRYYLDQGLLPAPQNRGRYLVFGEEHLQRLELIRRLKTLHLPLEEIRQLLASASDLEIHQRLEAAAPFGLEAGSSESGKTLSKSPTERSDHLPGRPPLPSLQLHKQMQSLPDKLEKPGQAALDYLETLADTRRSVQELKPNLNALKPSPNRPFAAPAGSRSQSTPWQRLELIPGVELHFRDPLDPDTRRLVEDLIEFARNYHRKP